MKRFGLADGFKMMGVALLLERCCVVVNSQTVTDQHAAKVATEQLGKHTTSPALSNQIKGVVGINKNPQPPTWSANPPAGLIAVNHRCLAQCLSNRLYFPRKNGHVILGFCLLYHRRNRVTLSPEPPGILRFGLAPAGSGPGPVGRAEAATPAVCKAAAALKVRPEQSSILRCNIETLGSVAFTVNYLPKLCFIVTRRLVSQCAVEPLVIVVKLDVFEDLTPGLGPAAEDLLLRKTFCFQRTEECLHHRIIKAICCPTHALSGPNNTQRFAHCLAAVLAASIGVKVQALFRLAQNQGIPQRRNNQFRLQCLTKFPTHHPAAEQIQDYRQVKPSLQGGDIGDITDPDLIGTTRLDLLDQVGRRFLTRRSRPWPKSLLRSSS